MKLVLGLLENYTLILIAITRTNYFKVKCCKGDSLWIRSEKERNICFPPLAVQSSFSISLMAGPKREPAVKEEPCFA